MKKKKQYFIPHKLSPDGLVLIYIYEHLTGKSVGKYTARPTKTPHKLNNLTVVLGAMKKDGILTGDIRFFYLVFFYGFILFYFLFLFILNLLLLFLI